MKIDLIQDTKDQQTLRQFLKSKQISTRTINKIRRNEIGIKINDKLAKLQDLARKFDKVTLVFPPEKDSQNLQPFDDDLQVLYEDDSWLIVNKIAGINSVPGPSDRSHTLVNIVLSYLQRTGQDNIVPRIMTRLDRDTSGVVLFAKNSFLQGVLSKQKKEARLEKIYLAVVSGRLDKNHDIIDLPLGRKNPDDIKRTVFPGGKQSVTEYWVQKRFTNATLVKVKLHTGRTHQIRAHFSHLGHALVGDSLYGGIYTNRYHRQLLHAWQLSFINPLTSEEIIAQAQVPKDFLEMKNDI